VTWEPTDVVDPMSALVAHLRTGLTVAAGGRVFAEQLPGSETSAMPRSGVLLRHAGGPGAPAHAQLVLLRIDAHCYGATPYAAMLVHWELFSLLRDLQRVVVGGTLLHSATPETGPISQIDSETEWPEVVSSWLVTAAERVPA
jgi:hypothetical protein